VVAVSSNKKWSEAAKLSRSISDDLIDSATRDHLIILNAPDNLRGVPVFHNGLPEALQYFQNRKRFKQVEIISFQEIQSKSDKVALTVNPESLALHLLNPNDDFARVQASECLEITAQTKTSLELKAQPCLVNVDLFVFDSGRVTKLPDQ